MQNGVLLDTDVVSFILKNDSRAIGYLPHISGRLPVISFMTVAELDRWALARAWGDQRKQALEAHLQRFVIYPFDRQLCRAWAAVTDAAQRKGRPIQCADAWIAATALHLQLPLLTHNVRDYTGVEELQIVSLGD